MSCLLRQRRLILLFAAIAVMVGLVACERSKADVVKATATPEIVTGPGRDVGVGTLPEVTPTATPTAEIGQPLPTPAPQTPQPAATTVSVAPTPTTVIPPAAVATPTTPAGGETSPGGDTTLPREPRYHIVQPGEWVYSIARRYGVSPQAIIRANNLRPPRYIIVPGQRLVIPEDGGAPPPAGGRVHIVKAGDTLYSIAVRYGTTVEAIKRANGLRNNIIYVGQRLIIPSGGGGGGGTPPSSGPIHVVRAGETLYSIAVRYGVTVEAIKRANGLRNNIIYVGQRLIIPKPTPHR